jgi:acyl-CoA thioesterase-1
MHHTSKNHLLLHQHRPGRFWRSLLVFSLSAVLVGLSALSPGGYTAGSLVSDAQAESVSPRVMAIGDSITEAQGGHASYRYWLYKSLQANGYATNFVGSMYGVYNGTPQYPDFDQNHEGHWGWRADQVLAGIENWSRDARPEIALIHLGTNDIFQKQTPTSTITEVGQIIDKMRIHNPSVVILVAQLIPSTSSSGARISEFNALVPALASQKSTTASPVVVVDQWTGYDAATDNYDGTHPNELGEKKMANNWHAAMTPFLPSPVITPLPADTQAPSVAISSPVDGASVAKGATIAITATADDSIGVDRVTFYANGALICTDTVEPFVCNWKAPRGRATSVSLTASATDAARNTGTSTAVNVITQ